VDIAKQGMTIIVEHARFHMGTTRYSSTYCSIDSGGCFGEASSSGASGGPPPVVVMVVKSVCEARGTLVFYT
jgi:hypothetical protein